MAAPLRDEPSLLAMAQRGDEAAYRDLVEPYRRELHAHCYRVLASFHDAEDALQDTLLRAWRGLGGFQGRSSVRSWLYKLAANASLDASRRRRRRELPTERRPPAGLGDGPGAAAAEVAWAEPYPEVELEPVVAASPERLGRRLLAVVQVTDKNGRARPGPRR